MERVTAAYKMYGGSLRYVIECVGFMKAGQPATERIDSAITEKCRAILEHFFGAGFGGPEDSISDVLIHRNPRIGDDGQVKYDVKGMKIIYSFASPFVFHQILSFHSHNIATLARQKFDLGTFRGSEDGEKFELLCFHCFKFSGVTFSVRPLDQTLGLSDGQIVFPPVEILPLNWKVRSNYLQENLLYLPPVGNLESGDAFCVMQFNGAPTLIVLQATIAERHPIKMNGLKVISECFNSCNIHVASQMLIFVTPKDGKLSMKQALVTQKNIVAQSIPGSLARFATNQYMLENHFN